MVFNESDILKLNDGISYVVSKIIFLDGLKYCVLVNMKKMSDIKYMLISNEKELMEVENPDIIREIAVEILHDTNIKELLSEVKDGIE